MNDRLRVIDTPEFIVDFEDNFGHTVAHCIVKVPWTSGVKRRLLREWSRVTTRWPDPILAIHNGDEKHQKFLEMFGFERVGPGECNDGKTRDVYVRRNTRP